MDRSQKEDMVSQLKQIFADSVTVVVTHYSGLTVAEMTDLREKMREVGAGYKVTKNRLTRLALDGTDIKDLSELFVGPTGIAFSTDPVAAAKVAANFAKTNEKLIILGGVYDGQIMDIEGIGNLAKLPSLDELRGSIVGMIQTPATRIAGILQVPATQVARVIGAYQGKDEAA